MFYDTIKRTPIYFFWREVREIREYWRWIKNGKPAPPPHSIKQGIVKEYARRYKCDIFFETGTYLGGMIDAVRNDFQQIFSIELSSSLAQKARERFRDDKYIHILQGNSAKLLPDTIKTISKPCLFWLDAHYSGEGTAISEKRCPILEELSSILTHPVKNHVVLIDDAREFTGRGGYPHVDVLLDYIRKIRSDIKIRVKTDIIRITEG